MKSKSKEEALFFEDLHYSFLEFGGNQIVHYDFAENEIKNSVNKISALKITNRIMVIHDRDDNKEARHQNFSTQLGDRYLELPVREIENLLSPSIINKLLQHYAKKNGTNLEFDIHTKQEDYAKIPFGTFLSKYIESGQIKEICSTSSENKIPVLYNKADFALAATGLMESWDELSPDAKALTIKVYDFIKSNNG